MKKTNAIRILESKKIKYEEMEYDASKGISGVDVAISTGENPQNVYKTLVTISNKKEYFVFIIPVVNELDLKKAASVSNSKKIEMLLQRDLLGLTGYVHGGCSPIGMKKLFKTFIDESAKGKEYIFVSGGKIGVQVKINPQDLINIVKAEYVDIIV
ncbi:Cys-tRNA(Pro) deacylase [Sneathia sanguinegens]|uniref:Cys-tRNA(Pro)/Cys-tRNA(Cys) deacylase n=1 Tax=Sneathia sanguinegens TaxID=40543 RepID=A0ABT7HJ66_9FUSO|nr:Cys-tRNA(Pro) deacylase [Sneathia sanguinegens]MDK9580558.1 Cys-tRNA(Pro) deacylase [Sneathia sanguinegens]